MNRKWHLWRWSGIISILLGSVLAIFEPTLNGSGDMADFEWRSILLRFFGFAPLCFFGFALLVFLLKFTRIIFRWMFTRRALKWFLRAFAFLLLLLALFYLEENWRGNRAWENFKQEREARGEKFDFVSFIPPPVPDDQNFALAPAVASCYSRVMDRHGQRIQPENTNVVNRLKMTIYRAAYNGPTNVQLGSWQKAALTDLPAWQNYYRVMFVTNRLGGMPLRMPPPAPPGLGRPTGDPRSAESELVASTAREQVEALATNEFPVAPQPQSAAADVLLALSQYDPVLEELRTASRLPYSRFPLNYTPTRSSFRTGNF